MSVVQPEFRGTSAAKTSAPSFSIVGCTSSGLLCEHPALTKTGILPVGMSPITSVDRELVDLDLGGTSFDLGDACGLITSEMGDPRVEKGQVPTGEVMGTLPTATSPFFATTSSDSVVSSVNVSSN